jgi:hypothetical protein
VYATLIANGLAIVFLCGIWTWTSVRVIVAVSVRD